MELMQQYGIVVPKGSVASTPKEAEDIAASMLQGVGGECVGRAGGVCVGCVSLDLCVR